MMMMMMMIMMCRCLIILLCRLEITGVSAWVRAPLPLQSYRNVNSNGITTGTAEISVSPPKSTVYSTIEDIDTSIKTTTTPTSTTTIDTDTDTPSVAPQQQSSRSIIAMPSIQYTVPGMKRGWKNSDTGIWMDEDGPRNGPPQNYWRQQSDEKLYQDSMQLVQDLLQLNQFRSSQGIISNTTTDTSSSKDTTAADDIERNDIIRNDLINGLVQPLEKSNSVRRPFLNRLILGDWAPIVRDGEVIAAGKGSSSSYSSSTTTSINYSNEINVPYCFHMQRTVGQKLAPKTHYGTFDEHLDAEEEVTIQQRVATISPSSSSSIDGKAVVTTSSGVVKVSSKNENRLVKGFCSDNDLFMGGITYVSKYMMIMRREQLPLQENDKKNNNAGSVIEIWMRIDPNV
jgi:hypothetical protein